MPRLAVRISDDDAARAHVRRRWRLQLWPRLVKLLCPDQDEEGGEEMGRPALQTVDRALLLGERLPGGRTGLLSEVPTEIIEWFHRVASPLYATPEVVRKHLRDAPTGSRTRPELDACLLLAYCLVDKPSREQMADFPLLPLASDRIGSWGKSALLDDEDGWGMELLGHLRASDFVEARSAAMLRPRASEFGFAVFGLDELNMRLGMGMLPSESRGREELRWGDGDTAAGEDGAKVCAVEPAFIKGVWDFANSVFNRAGGKEISMRCFANWPLVPTIDGRLVSLRGDATRQPALLVTTCLDVEEVENVDVEVEESMQAASDATPLSATRLVNELLVRSLRLPLVRLDLLPTTLKIMPTSPDDRCGCGQPRAAMMATMTQSKS